MTHRAHQEQPPMNRPHVGWFAGQPWQYNPGDEQCAACYTREQGPGQDPPKYKPHVTTPHPDGSGWRIHWIFLLLILGLFGCLLAGWLPPELLALAAGVC